MHSYTYYHKLIEEALVPQLASLGEIPEKIFKAAAYSLDAGGKRLRPVLLLASCELCGGNLEDALPYACAVEMIHTYSLIHDDLPALDNDDERRHRPSCHIAFGEDMAILAGDGLLSAAAELMFREALRLPDSRGAKAGYALMKRAGICGMVAGQTLDVTLEGQEIQEANVRYIHEHKTADLITGAVEAGMHLAGCPDADVAYGTAFGRHLGLAFQMVDDLLDVVGDSAVLGKKTGLDAEAGKQTWIALRGIDGTREDIQSETKAAIEAISHFGEDAVFFTSLAQDMTGRVQ